MTDGAPPPFTRWLARTLLLGAALGIVLFLVYLGVAILRAG